MESEASKLRAAKTALESAMSTGALLVDVTKDLHDANKTYNEASMQVRKKLFPAKAEIKGQGKGEGKCSCSLGGLMPEGCAKR